MRARSACRRGGRTADACVLSERPVAETTLLPAPERIAIQRASGVLPSRAAYNLFWVGRYVERAEATLRLVRALINRITEAGEAAAAITARVSAISEAWSAGPNDIPQVKPGLIAEAALTRRDCEGSLPRLVAGARSAASVIRDRLSPDAWRALNDLVAAIDAPLPAGSSESIMLDRVERALRIIASFSGLGAGEHDAARRLAVSRARPPHRARHPDLPVRARARRCDRARTARSTCCSSSATAR